MSFFRKPTPLPVTQGGTGNVFASSGYAIIGNGYSAYLELTPSTSGNIMTSNGTTWTSAPPSSGGVTTFTAGTTGFTPSSATSGAITLAGTLAATSGGTGSNSAFTTNGVAYATSTSALATSSGLTYNGTNLTQTGSSGTLAFNQNQSISGAIVNTKTSTSANSLGTYDQFATKDNTGTTNTWAVGVNVNTANSSWELYNGGTRFLVTQAGLVGIGTTTPAKTLDVSFSTTSTTATTAATMQLVNPQNAVGYYSGVINFCRINSSSPMAYIGSIQTDTTGNSANGIVFGTRDGGATVDERVRIAASGNLGVGETNPSVARLYVTSDGSALDTVYIKNTNTSAGTNNSIVFVRGASAVGTIQTTLSTTAYNTSSDYRLKENIAPMVGALAKVTALKPVTYRWKLDGSEAEGFIAHELAEVCPQAVSGTKDEVDADGNPKYQGIDTSFLVATLTSAIQELSTLITAQSATITSLTERISALENR